MCYAVVDTKNPALHARNAIARKCPYILGALQGALTLKVVGLGCKEAFSGEALPSASVLEPSV